MGTININVQKKFLKWWYKKKKITLQDVSLSKKKMSPQRLAKKLLSSLKLNQRQSLQKEMKQNHKKDTVGKIRRSLTQRNNVLQI